ncbi:glutamate-cysteine ligase family protein [Phytomonospora sp. NPDC050363]|uniref:glutamate-cysteine ligase family protein n=1 Tax=Phytomonospora sp. NPDC050363 TaxID=3155642 RepID=UPI00340C4781
MPTMTLDRAGLRAPFTGTDGERVGLEVEAGLVDAETGRSLPYEGPNGTGALITAIAEDAEQFGERATVVAEDGNPLAVDFGAGDRFSLEMGGALEYSSSVHNGVDAAVAHTGRRLRQAARVAATMNAAVLSGGYLPFTPPENIPWVPKGRLAIMRHHFLEGGEHPGLISASMGLTLSTQVTLDYLDEDDLAEKLWAINLASPVVAAMFANSPLESGGFEGYLSKRLQAIQHTDTDRFGILPFAVSSPPTVDEIVDWALTHPMIFREEGEGYIPAPDIAFAEALATGFGDGTFPNAGDWDAHLDQLWPYVRVRNTLEIRICDGPFWRQIGTVPAFWSGLLYHRPSRLAALDLLAGLSHADLQATAVQVTTHGLKAKVGDRSAGDLCRELLALSERGLAARVRAGAEAPGTPRLLSPLWNVVRTGKTSAERGLARWRGEFGQSPAEYVRAHRIR